MAYACFILRSPKSLCDRQALLEVRDGLWVIGQSMVRPAQCAVRLNLGHLVIFLCGDTQVLLLMHRGLFVIPQDFVRHAQVVEGTCLPLGVPQIAPHHQFLLVDLERFLVLAHLLLYESQTAKCLAQTLQVVAFLGKRHLLLITKNRLLKVAQSLVKTPQLFVGRFL